MTQKTDLEQIENTLTKAEVIKILTRQEIMATYREGLSSLSIAWYDLTGKLNPIFPGDWKFPNQLPSDVLEECLKNVYPDRESPENKLES